ncbi:MAG TPA: sugar phosphate nucleotidyltransferase [Patescibacteria group bacterium]
MPKFRRPTKAVIPAAGFGTRFLPQTKALPKEMLPVVDKPIIQYIVEGLVDAGIKDIIIVTGYHKRAIEDHFDKPSTDLVENLKMGGEKKKPLLENIEKIANMANFIYVRQKGPYGNGTPLLNVAHLIGNEPFIYTWSDDLIDSNPSEFEQLIGAYEKYGASCLSCVKAKTDKDYERYGYVGGSSVENGVIDVETLIEKPGKDNAPSDLGTVSSFLFESNIFNYVDEAVKNLKSGDELYYVDILNLMMKDQKKVYGIEIKNGIYRDLGNKLEYLKTVVEYAKKDPEIGKQFSQWLSNTNTF